MRGAIVLLWLGLFVVFGLFAYGYVENTDAEITMHSARSWYLRGRPAMLRNDEATDVSVAEDYIARRIHDDHFLGRPGTDGAAYSCFALGHQLLMLPCVALGERLARWLPAPEVALAAARPPVFGEFFWIRFLVSFLPIAAAAGTVVVLVLLAHTLGTSRAEALLVGIVAALATQLGGSMTETLSNGPGGFFLAAAVLGCVWNHVHGPSRVALLLAGINAGCAVLVRYEHAAPVAVAAAWTLWSSARRRHGWMFAGWFVAGGLPAAVFLATFNAWRFGSPFDAGYTGANDAWWSYPPYLGIPLVLFAPGKGVFWFSLPVVWALAICWQHRMRNAALVLVAITWVIPVILAGHTHGWHGSQCWGVRYVTIGTALFATVAFAIDRPWRRRPVAFAIVALLGLLVSAGGLLTPYRGHLFLADQAARQVWRAELDAGQIAPGTMQDYYFVDPRFSPVHTHWRYAWHAARGRLAAGPAERNTELVFGVEGPLREPVPGFRREDLGFRHWWWRYVADLVPFAWRPIAISWAIVGLLLTAFGVRAWLRVPAVVEANAR